MIDYSEVLSYVISFTSAIMLWLMGNKTRWGPIVGIGNQILWVVYVLLTSQWGLLPGVVMYLFIHVRNLYKWQKK